MSDADTGRSAGYKKTWTAFEKMSMEEKAAFLVDAAVSMVTQGVGEAGKVVSQVIDDIVSNIDAEVCDTEPEAAPEPPKKASPKRKTTRKKAASTTTRKSAKPKTES